MPQYEAHFFGIDFELNKAGRKGMAQVMEPDALQAHPIHRQPETLAKVSIAEQQSHRAITRQRRQGLTGEIGQGYGPGPSASRQERNHGDKRKPPDQETEEGSYDT